jgi:hypothetical protein
LGCKHALLDIPHRRALFVLYDPHNRAAALSKKRAKIHHLPQKAKWNAPAKCCPVYSTVLLLL